MAILARQAIVTGGNTMKDVFAGVIPAGAKPPSLAPLTARFGIGTIPVAAAALTQSLFGTFKELKDFALSDMTASDRWPAVPSGYGYHSLSMPLGAA
jgi:hypothetical protein